MKLWVSIIITIVVCELLILGGISVLPVETGKAKPSGNVAESPGNPTPDFEEQYREWLDLP